MLKTKHNSMILKILQKKLKNNYFKAKTKMIYEFKNKLKTILKNVKKWNIQEHNLKKKKKTENWYQNKYSNLFNLEQVINIYIYSALNNSISLQNIFSQNGFFNSFFSFLKNYLSKVIFKSILNFF